MTKTLITGANKGLGREAARRLLADGHDVWLAARDPAKGQAAAEELRARFVVLDVTDDASGTASRQSSRAPRSSSGWRRWTGPDQRGRSSTRTAWCPGDQ